MSATINADGSYTVQVIACPHCRGSMVRPQRFFDGTGKAKGTRWLEYEACGDCQHTSVVRVRQPSEAAP